KFAKDIWPDLGKAKGKGVWGGGGRRLTENSGTRAREEGSVTRATGTPSSPRANSSLVTNPAAAAGPGIAGPAQPGVTQA
ncbi:hypothetical protein MC885_011164, partial [Smutsia gigantea]